MESVVVWHEVRPASIEVSVGPLLLRNNVLIEGGLLVFLFFSFTFSELI